MSSPIPNKKPVLQMDFGGALREVMAGNKVTKLEWNDLGEYILLKDGNLCIKHSGDDDVYHRFLIRDVDMKGIDWVVLE